EQPPARLPRDGRRVAQQPPPRTQFGPARVRVVRTRHELPVHPATRVAQAGVGREATARLGAGRWHGTRRPDVSLERARSTACGRTTLRARRTVVRANGLQQGEQRVAVVLERGDDWIAPVDQVGRDHASPLVVVLSRVVDHAVNRAQLQEPGLEGNLDGCLAESGGLTVSFTHRTPFVWVEPPGRVAFAGPAGRKGSPAPPNSRTPAGRTGMMNTTTDTRPSGLSRTPFPLGVVVPGPPPT